MSKVFDGNTEKDAKAIALLESRRIGWLTTIAKDGTPRAVPVWFWWEDGLVYVVTEPNTGKVAQIKRGSPVLFHLETGPTGNDVVILHGTAEISPQPTTAWLAPRREAYAAKYADAVADYGMPLERIAEIFSTTIVFTPERAQSW